MKHPKLMGIAASTLALALFVGGCGDKKDEAPQSTGAAPMSEKSPGISQGSGSDTGSGTAQGQKAEEKKESSKG